MAQFIKANNQTALNTSGSYTTTGVPGVNDELLFNSTFAGFTSVPLGGALSVNKLTVTNPTNNFSIGTTSANLTVGSGGVDMSAATKDVTMAIPANIAINSATGGLTIANGRTFAATGIISFGNGLRQYGSGTLNIYSPVGSQVVGDAYVEGLLRVGNGTDSRIYTTTDRIFAGNMVLSGAFSFEGTGTQTITGVISGPGVVVKYNTGTLQLNAANTFSGNLTIAGGSGSTNAAASGNGSGIGFLTSSRTVDVRTGTTFTFSNIDYPTLPQGITDETKIPAFIVSGTLYATSGYTILGAVTLNSGSLKHDRPVSYVSPGFTFLNNVTSYGTSYITGSTRDDGQNALKPNASTVFDVQNGTLTIGHQLVDSLYNGLSGSSGLTKNGSGTLRLSKANTYIGGTTINGGTLEVDVSAGTGLLGAITVNSGSTLSIYRGNALGIGVTSPTSILVNSGTIFFPGTSAASTFIMPVTLGEGSVITGSILTQMWFYGNGSITATGNSTISQQLYLMQNAPISVSAGKTLTINAPINNSGDALGVTRIIKNGQGTLRINAVSNFAGPVNLFYGNIHISCSGGATGGTGLANTVHVTPSGSESSASLTLDGNISFGYGRDKILYLNALSSSNATVIPTLIASGNLQEVNSITYLYGSGSTKYAKITGSMSTASMTNGLYLEGNPMIVSGGTGHIIEVSRLSPWGTSQWFDIVSGSKLTINSPIKNHGSALSRLYKKGTGTLTIAKTNTYSNQTNIEGGTLEISGSGCLSSDKNTELSSSFTNGGFESTTLSGEWAYNNGTTATSAGWSGYYVISTHGGGSWGVPSNGSSTYSVGIQTTNWLSRTVYFNRTGRYLFRWQANGRSGTQVNPYRVRYDWSDVGPIFTWSTTGGTWKYSEYEINVTSVGNHEIGFSGLGDGTDVTVFFDNLTLTYVPDQVESYSQVNLIKNGNFEDNTLTTDWASVGSPALVPNWSTTEIITKMNEATWQLPANGNSKYSLGIHNIGEVSQSINFTKTGKYILNWQAVGRYGVEVNPYYVRLDGQDVSDLLSWETTGGTWKWYQQEINITTTGSHTIGFRGTNVQTGSSDHSVFFDNVSLAYAEYTGDIVLSNNSTIIYSSSADQVFKGQISGSGTLKKYNTSSSLIIGNQLSATATLEITEGTLKVLPVAKLSATTLTLNGGNLELGNN